MTPATMREPPHHLLVEIEPGGLLLDLASGALLQLNAAAAFIWRLHLDGAPIGDTAAALAARYGISAARAHDDVVAAIQAGAAEAGAAPATELRYERAPGGYVFKRAGRPLLEIDGDGRQVARAAAGALTPAEARDAAFSVAPKLLSLRGHTVLHASAVVVGGGAVALAGASGAGKTTTARALVRAGATPVCEDKLLLLAGAGAGGGDVVEAPLHAEAAMRAWAEAAAAELVAAGTASCDGLEAAAAGPAAVVREIGLLDAAARAAGEPAATPLSRLAAAGALFRHSFYGSDAADDWRRQLDAAARLARAVDACDLRLPEGLGPLAAAAARIAARGALRA
jgi:hypothetical protein